MKGGEPGETDWDRIEVAPDPEHYADFANLAVDVARRYPQVRHFVVWNELKGFFGADRNRWDIQSYTELYNTVYRALKAYDPTLRVGGPYVVMNSWSDPHTASDPSELAGPWASSTSAPWTPSTTGWRTPPAPTSSPWTARTTPRTRA